MTASSSTKKRWESVSCRHPAVAPNQHGRKGKLHQNIFVILSSAIRGNLYFMGLCTSLVYHYLSVVINIQYYVCTSSGRLLHQHSNCNHLRRYPGTYCQRQSCKSASFVIVLTASRRQRIHGLHRQFCRSALHSTYFSITRGADQKGWEGRK